MLNVDLVIKAKCNMTKQLFKFRKPKNMNIFCISEQRQNGEILFPVSLAKTDWLAQFRNSKALAMYILCTLTFGNGN